MFKVKKIGTASLAKMLGAVYAAIGFLVGLFVSAFSAILMFFGGQNAGLAGIVLGVGAVIIFPIFYGILGVIFGSIIAIVYNAVADRIGGIEVELDE